MPLWLIYSVLNGVVLAVCMGAMQASAQWFASSVNSDEVYCFDAQSGVLTGSGPFIPAGSGGLSRPHGILDCSNGLLVASFNTGEIKRYDRDTGAYAGNFITNGAGLSLPVHMAYGPDDGLLYISSQGNDRVLRFDPDSGDPADGTPFIDGGLLNAPSGFDWSPNGMILYVAGRVSGNVLAYDAVTGAPLTNGHVLAQGIGTGNDTFGLAVDDQSGDVFVASGGDVIRFDSAGTTQAVIAVTGTSIGLELSPDGNSIVVASSGNLRLIGLASNDVSGAILSGAAIGTLNFFHYSEIGAQFPACFHRPWPELVLTPFLSGLDRPLMLIDPRDGTDRLFAIEQPGRVRVVIDGALDPVPVLDITSQIHPGFVEGLLGIAIPPGFSTQQNFYVSYVRTNDLSLVISRFHMSTSNVDRAEATSEEVILEVPEPLAIHFGGHLEFGPIDNYLYLALGDSGPQGDPNGYAQDPQLFLGKMLRIDVLSTPTPTPSNTYVIPPDNPFVGNTNVLDEIWAIGLRNPWRFSFDPLQGDLFLTDVGWNTWEEVNYTPHTGTGGVNYGWSCLEGPALRNTNGCNLAALTGPVHLFASNGEGNCSVTGGYVSRKNPWSNLYGTYLYSDWCSARVWGLRQCGNSWTNRELTVGTNNPAAFGTDRFGNIYLLEHTSGDIKRIDEIHADLDSDGQPDEWEMYYGFSTNDASDASADEDGDGVSNEDEFVAGTDPTDRDDFPQLHITRNSPVTLSWPATVDRKYDIEMSDTLATNSWSGLYTNIPGENAELQRQDTNSATRRYYRLQIRAP